MAYEPSVDAILLFRRNMGQADPDTVNLIEYYYEPATRDSNAFLTTAPVFEAFALSTAVIIDRWCVAPGIAPFTEARVHRTGAQGAIATDFIDGVTSCQIICTLGLTLTASAVRNGRADLTATISGGQGPVLLSLNGFQTPGLPPETATTTTYLDCRPGRYTVTARETRAGGCTATATVTFAAPYGPRYEVTFKDLDSTACLLRVFEREYAGAVEELEAQEEAVSLDWVGGATDHLFTQLVNGSECQLALYLMRDDQLLPLFSGDERLHRVYYYRAGALIWTGYLQPEQYDVAFLTPPATFNLSATDGLGTLSTIPFAGSGGEALRGDWSVLQVMLFCLGKLDLALPLHTLFHLYPNGAAFTRPALEQAYVDVAGYQDDKGEPWDCGKVLDALLKPTATRIYQQDGAWWLERLSELTGGATTYATYAADGTPGVAVVVNRLVEVSAPDAQPHWLNGSQRLGLRPAVGQVEVTADPGEPVNLLRFALPTNADLPGLIPASWTAASATPDVPWSQLLYAGKDKPPILRLIGKAGPQFGYPTLQAGTQAALRAPWVQLPVAPPLPMPHNQGNAAHNEEVLVLRFTAKPFGHTPETAIGKFSFMIVAVQYGPTWIGGISGAAESAVPQPVGGANFETTGEVEAVVVFGDTARRGPQPVQIRLFAPVGGATACTVDITDISLQYETIDPEINEAYTTRYSGNTGQLVSRVDTGTELFHSDVPHARLAGTWLDQDRLPVQGWREPGNPMAREAGDYLVRDRLGWQAGPAQALTGTLRGQLPGPGTLLTDPTETRPAVYVLTSCQHRAASAEWDVTGVQNLLLQAPAAAFPDNAIYFDNLAAWQDEDEKILVYENA